MGRGRGRGGDDDEKTMVGCSVFCCLLIIGSILLGVSFSVLEPNEVGLEYNANTLKLYSELYTGGRYFLGVGHSFVKFPTTMQTIKFSGGDSDFGAIMGRTKDGLAVEMSISLQYKYVLDASSLRKLYVDFAENHLTTYIKIARSVVRDVASEYTAFQFFADRTIIGATMQVEMNSAFVDVYSTVPALQLLNVELPIAFSDAIQKTVNAQQDIEKAEYEQNAVKISSQTEVFKAVKDAEIVVINANATAQATLAAMKAQAKALTTQLSAEKDAYKAAKTKFVARWSGYSNKNLLTYVWLDAVANNKASAQTLAVDKPSNLELYEVTE